MTEYSEYRRLKRDLIKTLLRTSIFFSHCCNEVEQRKTGTAKTATSVFLIDSERVSKGREGVRKCHTLFSHRGQENDTSLQAPSIKDNILTKDGYNLKQLRGLLSVCYSYTAFALYVPMFIFSWLLSGLDENKADIACLCLQ